MALYVETFHLVLVIYSCLIYSITKYSLRQILLYEDQAVLPSLQVKAPLFKNHVSQFSEHNSAILAGNLWTALELDGFGANLQHFNPYIDARVAVEWALPSQWTLKAQLVFGTAVEGPNPDKKYGNLEERILVFGKQ
jgi:predicted oxidoreductase (fatty acid repression mutant protein)